ncbi:hypothetical protein EX895_006430 [Sporisorium graminicola]|uniref:DUF676 domain-containing protein n=1 Tax=Sporisorium graminicola TaxID=280036 RepID=A0A4U7KNB2_9BASI|nr:hypothetical protein EX895_006430 [Sporisorium graminicola]TKY84528.1 hypothetical protein EX895_006430 [Sporisorium graminicola]
MPASTVHLVIIHHGLWGTPANTEYLTTTLAKHHGGTVSPACTLTPPESASTIAVHAETHPNAAREDVRMVVLNSEVNSGDHTYDGIDWCGERLVKDVYREVGRIEREEGAVVARCSLIGYSLGGLVIRYAAGVMYADGFFAEEERKGGKELGFRSRPVAASLSTIATPHLGVTLTGSTFSKVAARVGSSNLGRTGKQLYLADRGWIPPSTSTFTREGGAVTNDKSNGQDAGLCLVEALSDPRFTFIAALRLFQRIDIYANAVADLTVSYRTAAFETHDPFLAPDRLSLERDPDHPPLLVSYSAITTPARTKSFWRKVASQLSPNNLPWMLNPQRFPFRFPLNYVALVCLPVLLPVMVGLVLHKLRSDSKVSNRRVEEFERVWAEENGLLLPAVAAVDAGGNGAGGEDADSLASSKRLKQGLRKNDAKSKVTTVDKATRSEWERKRISNLLAAVEAEAEEALREVGEDYVATSAPFSPSSLSTNDDNDDDTGRYTLKPNTPTRCLCDPSSLPIARDEYPLLDIQHRIVANLNNRALLPQVQKHLAHFDDVLNAHAVIIVRTVTMEMHKKGIPLIKAFVQRFGL